MEIRFKRKGSPKVGPPTNTHLAKNKKVPMEVAIVVQKPPPNRVKHHKLHPDVGKSLG